MVRSKGSLRRAQGLLALFLTLLAGCGHCGRQQVDIDLPSDPYGPLPVGRDALLEESDRMVRDGPQGPSVPRSYRAAERCDQLHGGGPDGRWRMARALYYLTLTASSADDAAGLARRCMELEMGPDDPAEGHYYLALCIGARAQSRKMEGLSLVPKMVEQAEAALSKDPRALHAGPHRVLGGIYLRAPAWPLSVGDLDEALVHLEKATELGPQWAENYLMLAQALIEDGRTEEAKQAVAVARALFSDPAARGWTTFWKKDLDVIQERLSRK